MIGIKSKKQPIPFFKKAKNGRWYHWKEYTGEGNWWSDLNPAKWIKEEITNIGRDFAVFNVFAPAKDITPGDLIYTPGVKNTTVTNVIKTNSLVKIEMGNNTIPHYSQKSFNDPVFVQVGLGQFDIEIDDNVPFKPGQFDIEIDGDRQ